MVIEYRPAEKPKKAKKADVAQLEDCPISTRKVACSSPAVSANTIKRGPGRPPTGFDSKAYGRAYMKDKRAALKLGLTVREYRKQGKET